MCSEREPFLADEITVLESPYYGFYESTNEVGVSLTAIKDGNRLGKFDFLPPTKGGQLWKLGLLYVNDRYSGRGVGKRLLSEFARRAGAGATVTSSIIHDETFEYFEARNPHSESRRTVLITDKKTFAEIPLNRVLNSGGIEISSLTVIYNSPQESRYFEIRDIVLNGVVLPLPTGS